MSQNFLKRAVPAALLAALALAPVGSVGAMALQPENIITFTSPMAQNTEPVTIYGATTETIISLDPQRVEDATSIVPVENLFLGLTDLDPKTTAVRPEVASEWSVNDAGDTWTFTLRSDIPWVRYNPETGETTEIRKVTAQDFEYGIKRACDPRLGAYYSNVAAAMIEGCDLAFGTPVAELTDATFDQVAVKALSDTQLEIKTQGAIGFFLSASGMWVFRATPKEAIDEFGDDWTKPGNIVTNGPFVMAELDNNVNRVFLKNPLYPEDVNDNYGGNIERVNTIVVSDGGTIYSLYQNSEVDSAGAPNSELQNIRQDPELSKELRQSSDLAVFYFGFSYDKAPFDNVHARRAFSAVLDRQTFVTEILQGRAVPMAHFMPPGIRGAVPINEVGIGQPDTPGFDPEFAKKELELAGFPNCEGLPEINIVTFQGASDFAVFLQNAIQTHLGCDPTKIIIEEQEFASLLKNTRKDNPVAQRPHMFTLGWGPDYPDAHNWVHDVLSCNAENPFNRPCNENIDTKIDGAAIETDPATREEMYRNIEELFFGYEGDFPIAPLYLRIQIFLVKPWYTGFFDTDGLFGGPHWNTRRIDQAAQLAARGG
jgi:oligopeptide transport system substrate-binding protein